MKCYELIGHTADIRLKAEGSDLQNLFTAALEGMDQIINPGVVEDKITDRIDISVESRDTTSLLIDFLSDVLTQTQIRKAVFVRVDFKILTPTHLQATLYGAKIDHFDQDIKAVTYHEADVHKNECGNWETMIVFDI
jgi:SHS2 domain-containing protein